MSRRDQIRMTDDEVDAFIHSRQTMNVATFNHDGSIHLVAMWYGFLEGKPAFETYQKSQKVANLRRDGRMTVLMEDGDRYEELRGVELVGTGEVLDQRDDVITVAHSVVERYMDVKPEDAAAAAEILSNKRVAVAMTIERVVSWDHRKLGGSY
ncbi:MAG: TIGR03618 family F420-dependent PPOX class oxidoreductase [Actinomycetota bacterium]|nr:TIGR03618 family F420-dependent PPOX class oxidoreductase [Actinomycetota bacterium]